MSGTYIYEKFSGLKNTIQQFFQHRKKIKALENYSSASPFQHRKYLHMIKCCSEDGFLGEKEADFLDHMLTRYELNYLDWAYRTKWLKNLIAERSAELPEVSQFIFDFDKKPTVPINIPVDVLSVQKAMTRHRKAG